MIELLTNDSSACRLFNAFKPKPRNPNNFQQYRNVLTPHILGYVNLKYGWAEISEGQWVENKMYGVTVIWNNKHDLDKSEAFFSMEEVEEYIKTLIV